MKDALTVHTTMFTMATKLRLCFEGLQLLCRVCLAQPGTQSATFRIWKR